MPQTIPGVNAPPEPAQDEQAKQDVAKLLFQYGKPWSQQYEEWGERHPVLQFGAEQAANAALSEIPGGAILRRVGLHGLAKVADVVGQSYRQHDWASGARYIKDPKFKLGKSNPIGGEDSPHFEVDIHRADAKPGDTPYGRINYSLEEGDHGQPQVYLGWFGSEGDQPGTGQLTHVASEVLQRHPELKTVRFYRTSGAGVKNKQALEEVIMPIPDRYKSADALMLEKAAQKESGKPPWRQISRRRLGEMGTELEVDPMMEEINHVNQLGIPEHLNDAEWADAAERALRSEGYSDYQAADSANVALDDRMHVRSQQMKEELAANPQLRRARRERLMAMRPGMRLQEANDAIGDIEDTMRSTGHIPRTGITHADSVLAQARSHSQEEFVDNLRGMAETTEPWILEQEITRNPYTQDYTHAIDRDIALSVTNAYRNLSNEIPADRVWSRVMDARRTAREQLAAADVRDWGPSGGPPFSRSRDIIRRAQEEEE